MRRMKARFNSPCRGAVANCPGIKKGQSIIYDRGSRSAWHPGCGPTGVDPKADREYMQGLADYDRWSTNRKLFGEDYAAAEELAWELKLGDDY